MIRSCDAHGNHVMLNYLPVELLLHIIGWLEFPGLLVLNSSCRQLRFLVTTHPAFLRFLREKSRVWTRQCCRHRVGLTVLAFKSASALRVCPACDPADFRLISKSKAQKLFHLKDELDLLHACPMVNAGKTYYLVGEVRGLARRHVAEVEQRKERSEKTMASRRRNQSIRRNAEIMLACENEGHPELLSHPFCRHFIDRDFRHPVLGLMLGPKPEHFTGAEVVKAARRHVELLNSLPPFYMDRSFLLHHHPILLRHIQFGDTGLHPARLVGELAKLRHKRKLLRRAKKSLAKATPEELERLSEIL